MTTLQLLLIFLDTGFEVLIVLWIHNAVWVRRLNSLVHVYELLIIKVSVKHN